MWAEFRWELCYLGRLSVRVHTDESQYAAQGEEHCQSRISGTSWTRCGRPRRLGTSGYEHQVKDVGHALDSTDRVPA